VRTVRDWLEPTGFAHMVSVFGLALAIFGALLIPVDLYNVASLSDGMTGMAVEHDARQEILEHGAVITVLYQVIFLSLCGFLFVLLPLAYFWSEFAVQHPEGTPVSATLHAAGFASCFSVIAGLIGFLGTAIQPVPPPPQLESEAWAMQLIQEDSGPLGPAMDAVLGVALLLGTPATPAAELPASSTASSTTSSTACSSTASSTASSPSTAAAHLSQARSCSAPTAPSASAPCPRRWARSRRGAARRGSSTRCARRARRRARRCASSSRPSG
jgi:hypothetical protein